MFEGDLFQASAEIVGGRWGRHPAGATWIGPMARGRAVGRVEDREESPGVAGASLHFGFPMNFLLMLIPLIILIPAIYLLVTRRTSDDKGGGGREENTTDSPNDRPPPDAGRPRGTEW